MEWTKSQMSGAELERKRKEYMDAAMSMLRRAAPEPTGAPEAGKPSQSALKMPDSEHKKLESEAEHKVPEAEKKDPELERKEPELERKEPELERKEPEPERKEPETEHKEPERKEPEQIQEPEKMHEPEPLPEPQEKPSEKKTFGVFDMQQLTEAVKNGEMDGERLREAAEILEEMSGKTAEMQRLAGSPAQPAAEQPQSLNRYVQQHNSGSCPRCGQARRNEPRR